MKRIVLFLILICCIGVFTTTALAQGGTNNCQTFYYSGVPLRCSCISAEVGSCQCFSGLHCSFGALCVSGTCGNEGDGGGQVVHLKSMWQEWAWAGDGNLARELATVSPLLGQLIEVAQSDTPTMFAHMPPEKAKCPDMYTRRGGTFPTDDTNKAWAQWTAKVERDNTVIHFTITRIAHPDLLQDSLHVAPTYELYTQPSDLLITEHGWQVKDALGETVASGTFRGSVTISLDNPHAM